MQTMYGVSALRPFSPSAVLFSFFAIFSKIRLTNPENLLKYNVLLRARGYGEMAELVEGARLEIVYTL